MPQHEKATVEVAKWLVAATILTIPPWPISSDEKNSIVEEASKLAIQAQNRRKALAGAPVGRPSVCQLASSPSLKIDSPIQDAVSLEFCLLDLLSDLRY